MGRYILVKNLKQGTAIGTKFAPAYANIYIYIYIGIENKNVGNI